ncbi:hypothetical protein Tco_1527313 [Tanacetum coccineum]
MRQTKNLMDINIDALYNILKKNQGDVNDVMGYRKKAVVVTSDPLVLVAESTKINVLLAKAFNRKKYYAKPTNNNLRTSLASSSSVNKKPGYMKSEEKKEDKKADEKKQDMSKVKTKRGWSPVVIQIKRSMKIWSSWLKWKKVLSNSEETSSSAEETIAEVPYYTSDSESEFEYETLEYYDNSTNYGLFVDNDDDQEIFHSAIEFASENFNENHIVSQTDHDQSEVDHNDSEEKDHLVDKLIKKFNEKIAKCQKRIEKANQQSKDLENQNKDLQDKYDVLKN